MLLRDRLLARLAEMGPAPDHRQLAAEVLGIRNAPPDLARRLVAQALVVEDRQEAWRAAGRRIVAEAPASPGVYILRDEAGRPLYVGKAINLKRRLSTHFADRRWRALKADFARAAEAEWEAVGSELEALLREAELIRTLEPPVNIQVGIPQLETREIPRALVRDVIVVVPSVEEDSAELVAARCDGGWLIQRTRRSGADLAVHAARLMRFFHSPLRWKFDRASSNARGAPPPLDNALRRSPSHSAAGADSLVARGPQALAPIVFSWLAGRGARASRIDPHDAATPRHLRVRLAALLADEALFTERLVVR
jgi:predicted GIY-YIG superfamily endonuclease